MELVDLESWQTRIAEYEEQEGAGFTVLWNMLHARVFIDPEGTGYDLLSASERTVWVANVFIGEVLNGGFHQFFSNSSGDHASELPTVLSALGARSMLNLFLKAAGILSKGKAVPTNRVERNRALDSIDPDEEGCYEAFNALDAAFYALPETEYPNLLRYALDNIDPHHYKLNEVNRAVEQTPYLMFPGDRKAFARVDMTANMIHLELECGRRTVPLAEARTLTIHKIESKPGTSGLVYRLDSTAGTFDIPFFARGEGSGRSVFWYFGKLLKIHRLVGYQNALDESRRRDKMEPIEVWSNT